MSFLILESNRSCPNTQGEMLLPAIDVTLFQCGLIEKTIHSISLEDSVSHLARSNVVLLHIDGSTLHVSVVTPFSYNHKTNEVCFRKNFELSRIALF